MEYGCKYLFRVLWQYMMVVIPRHSDINHGIYMLFQSFFKNTIVYILCYSCTSIIQSFKTMVYMNVTGYPLFQAFASLLISFWSRVKSPIDFLSPLVKGCNGSRANCGVCQTKRHYYCCSYLRLVFSHRPLLNLCGYSFHFT